jgi:hypothetical protein
VGQDISPGLSPSAHAAEHPPEAHEEVDNGAEGKAGGRAAACLGVVPCEDPPCRLEGSPRHDDVVLSVGRRRPLDKLLADEVQEAQVRDPLLLFLLLQEEAHPATQHQASQAQNSVRIHLLTLSCSSALISASLLSSFVAAAAATGLLHAHQHMFKSSFHPHCALPSLTSWTSPQAPAARRGWCARGSSYPSERARRPGGRRR